MNAATPSPAKIALNKWCVENPRPASDGSWNGGPAFVAWAQARQAYVEVLTGPARAWATRDQNEHDRR